MAGHRVAQARVTGFIPVAGMASFAGDCARVDGDQLLLYLQDELLHIDLPTQKVTLRSAATPAPARSVIRQWPIDDTHIAQQISDQKLQTDRWTQKFPPYIYDVMRMPGGPLLVASSGRGGYLYEVDAGDGTVRVRTKVPGGASNLVRESDGARVIASGWESFLITDGISTRHLHKLRGAFRALWLRGTCVALLSNPPKAGVVFVDLA